VQKNKNKNGELIEKKEREAWCEEQAANERLPAPRYFFRVLCCAPLTKRLKDATAKRPENSRI